MWTRNMLISAGVVVGDLEEKVHAPIHIPQQCAPVLMCVAMRSQEYGGVKVQQGARVVLSPSFGVTQVLVLRPLLAELTCSLPQHASSKSRASSAAAATSS